MEHIFLDFYMAPRPHGLGLQWIDSDPFPSDPDDSREPVMRRKLMAGIGKLNEQGLEHIGLFLADDRDRPSTADNGLVGLLILAKPRANDTGPRQLCTGTQHQPTTIAEWDLRRPYRGQRLGRFLLRLGMHSVHPGDPVMLDVSQDSTDAIDKYRHYGFVPTGETFRHEVFDTTHARYIASGANLRQQVGTIALDKRP